MWDVVVSSIDLPPKFGRGGNFLRESKNLLGFWAEVVAVKILQPHEGSRFWSRRLKYLENYIWVLYKLCLENEVSQTPSKPILYPQEDNALSTHKSGLMRLWNGFECWSRDLIVQTRFINSPKIIHKFRGLLDQHLDPLYSSTIFTASTSAQTLKMGIFTPWNNPHPCKILFCELIELSTPFSTFFTSCGCL